MTHFLDKRPQGYTRLLADIQNFLEMEKIWNKKALNQIKVQIYWKMGERIFREILKEQNRADYGTYLLKFLAKDLVISARHLSYTLEFYKYYPFPQHISPELTWSHYCLLIEIKDQKIRRYYEIQAISNHWTVRQLKEKMDKNEHEKLQKAGFEFPTSVPLIPEREQIFREYYEFSFLDLEENYSEKDLEKALVKYIEKFLLELGYGFAYLGSQHKIVMDGQPHHIDLFFFHILLCCYIIVELKIERFKDEFVGQVNKYLNYIREHENLPYMRDPIGLIICKNKQTEEVHYAIGGLEERIFVSEYRLSLPKEEEIVKELSRIPIKKTKNISVRQKKGLNALAKYEIFTAYQYQKETKTSIATAKRDLKILVEKDILERQGKGKNVVYKKKL